MYLGKIVEIADKHSLFRRPRHPYTRALLSSHPDAGSRAQKERIILKGCSVPDQPAFRLPVSYPLHVCHGSFADPRRRTSKSMSAEAIRRPAIISKRSRPVRWKGVAYTPRTDNGTSL